ncbi:MAG: hypothetical protein R2867_11900 [Caldilineaceae bacterium]
MPSTCCSRPFATVVQASWKAHTFATSPLSSCLLFIGLWLAINRSSGAPSLDAEYLRALVNPGQPRFIDALKQLAPQVRQLLLLRYWSA